MTKDTLHHEDHDTHEEHEKTFDRLYRMRLPSPLSPAAEDAMSRTIGCAIRVHRELGPGFLESIYHKAMYEELKAAGLSFESQLPVLVKYRDTEISGQRVDLIVEGMVVVELKTVRKLDEIHRAQFISYLRTTGLRGGLLINFRVPVLQQGLKRVVL